MSSIQVLAVSALLVFSVVLVVYQIQQVGHSQAGAASPRTFRLLLVTGTCAALSAIGPLWNLVT